MQLSKVSSFIYETCGNLIKGKWKLNFQPDSVLLFCNDFKYKTDSLNHERDTVCNPNASYMQHNIISNKYLLTSFRYKNKYFYDRLEKEDSL